jgi:hypothetical protein
LLALPSSAGGGAPTAAAPLGDPASAEAASAFDARRHGFRFVNAFAGDVLVDVPLVGQVDLGDAAYGLCGGMTWAALDGFAAGAEAPAGGGADGSEPPESGTKLRSYLYGRQVDSLEADDAYLVRTLLAWSWRPVKSSLLWTGLLELSIEEFEERIAPSLDAGRPVALCLVRSDVRDYVPSGESLGAEGFLENHQVLAIGYRRCAATAGMGEHWGIDVYDPNAPRSVCTLHFSAEGRAETLKSDADGALVAAPDDPTRNVIGGFRGFFATPGKTRQPYWSEGGASLAERARDLSLAIPSFVAAEPAEKSLPAGIDEAQAVEALIADAEARLERLRAALAGLETAVAAAEARGRGR